MRKLIFVLMLFVAVPAQAESGVKATTIWYFQKDERFNYRIELLQHALSYSQTQAPKLIVKPLPGNLSDLRAYLKLLAGKQAIIVSTFSGGSLRGDSVVQIQPPILAGMLGFRVLLVRPDKVDYLSRLHAQGEFTQKAIAGFGAQWQDLQILQNNGIKVRASSQYLGLFDMLGNNRFDYFPRGLAEVFQELKVGLRSKSFQLHPKIALYYPFPINFHIGKKYQFIAQRVEYGLLQAKRDGSFKKLFQKHHQLAIKWMTENPMDTVFLEGLDPSSEDTTQNLDWWMSEAMITTMKNEK